ncbi:MAG: ComEC/Rec2 family competence protein [Planctomycetota bacterium]
MALAGGIAVGRAWTPAAVWPWLAVAAVGLGLAWRWRRRRPAATRVLTTAVCFALGAGRQALRHEHRPARHLAVLAGLDAPADPVAARPLVRVRGTALTAPRPPAPGAGSMARFGHRPAGASFVLAVERVVPGTGAAVRACGRVRVRVDEMIEPFEPGDRVEVAGRLHPPGPRRNPGDPDRRARARLTGDAGVLVVPGRALVRVTRGPPGGRSALRRWRHRLQRRVADRLLDGVDVQRDPRRAALLEALLLGRRDHAAAGLDESFRRVGLAHLLAISGLHLGILAGTVLLAARAAGLPRRGQGPVVVVAVLLYLVVIEPRLPVLRAAIMTVTASLGLTGRRSLHVGGLVALSAVALLLWRPAQLFTPGFQLSFGVVLGLVHLAAPVRRRWFGPPQREAVSVAQMLAEKGKTAVAASTVAWLVAAPIILHHHGRLAPLAAPLSVASIPVVAALLATGAARMLLGELVPGLAAVLAPPLTLLTDVLIAVVEVADRTPGAAVETGMVPGAWAVAALAWTAAWARARRRRGVWTTAALLVAWLAGPRLAAAPPPPLRADLLAVGDGTCLLVRSAGRAVVFDAGSGDLDAGTRTIVPTLRRLGIRSIDAIVISHANLDHCSAVLELVAARPVGEVLVTPDVRRDARARPGGPAAFLLARLRRHGVLVRVVAAGAERRFGDSTWRWHHPPPDHPPGAANEASMVVTVGAAGRRLLLTGDLEGRALRRIVEGPGDLRADILELPHHGSFGPDARRLVQRVRPRVVLQSTGPGRLRPDRWAGRLDGVTRLVTARDGMCTVIVERDGRIVTRRFAAR